MVDLRDLFVDLGHEDVQTYILSGNVVFRASGKASDVSAAISKRITKDMGLDVPVLLRTGGELAKLASGNPFLRRKADPSALHVNFLADKPGRDRVAALDHASGSPDEFAIVGRDVYVHCPKGYGRTKLNNAFFERKLATTGTTRNWKTVTKLSELAN